MKKTIRNLLVLVLTFCLTLSLCGCGKVDALIEQINLIGDVTLQSGDAIQTAEAAYAALNEDQQAKIENYSILQDARTVFDRILNVANLIDAIGVVTLESENAIIAAEDAYNALSEAEQAKIENSKTLSVARIALEDAKFEAFKDTLAGEWVTDFDNDQPFTLTRNVTDNESLWDGEWSWTAWGETFAGKWRLDRDTNTFVVESCNEEKECKLIEENGFLKLITNDWIWEDPACYVRADEYQAAFDAKFVAIEINSTNYKDYLTEPSLAGYSLDENGNPDKRYPIYLITNKLFEQGYVYMGTSYDFVYEITRQNIRNGEVIYEYSNLIKWHLFTPQQALFPYEEGTELRMTLGDQISGTIYFIKAEMVAENYCVPEYNYSTYLRTTNGAVYLTGGFIEADCKYEDHLR